MNLIRHAQGVIHAITPKSGSRRWLKGAHFVRGLVTGARTIFSRDFTIADVTLGEDATFSRASTAYHQQPDGTWVSVLSGEARYSGMRRVRNLLAYSEDIEQWGVATSGDATVTGTKNYAAGPDGSITAQRLQLSRGTSNSNAAMVRQALATSGPDPHDQIASVWIKSNDANTYSVALCDLNVGVNGGVVMSAGATWKRYQYKQANQPRPHCDFTIGIGVGFTPDTVSADILIWHPQQESFTGGSSGAAASEYVSCGVLSTPYHGSNVDGAKYFPHANGNTVASNVVTEAQGAALPGPFGLLMELAAINALSADRSNVPAGSIGGGGSSAKNAVGIDGAANMASTWTGISTSYFNFTSVYPDLVENEKISVKLRIKKEVGTAYDSTIRIVSSPNVYSWSITINKATGFVSETADTPPPNRAYSVVEDSGWWVITMYFTVGATLAAGLCYFQFTPNVDGNSTTIVDDIETMRGIAFASCRDMSPIIASDSGPITRAVDALAYSGIDADNETRFVIDQSDVDVDDWDGTMPTPTAPNVIASINVYAPGDRP